MLVCAGIFVVCGGVRLCEGVYGCVNMPVYVRECAVLSLCVRIYRRARVCAGARYLGLCAAVRGCVL